MTTVFSPGSIGNVGPGFDVLGLAFEGAGDKVTVTLTDGAARVESITGRDASLLPRDPTENVTAIAASAWLREAGIRKQPVVSIEKGLAVAGGMGGSAASAVGGALAACLAAGARPEPKAIMEAALEAESIVAGRHLDNIAASTLGGLAITLSVDPIDAISVPAPAQWRVVLLTPRVRIETKKAREILPAHWDRASWTRQMASTTALAYAFATADAQLVRRALDDRYAEPIRADLIPNFRDVKRAALDAGALGCSISGSGPTIFALTTDNDARVAEAMRAAMREVPCDVHAGMISKRGAHAI
ncbi:MAG TPA: homoserine kinase [Thermoanaerobaculia bacterium]|nr:homoserine kinase [Thermoanaerobaculia bacterium]